MEKLKMQSHDVIGSNTQKIAQLFPNCVTERLGKDGKPELAIDFEKLQAELSNEIIAEGEERYQFTWPDKRAAVRLANTPTTMTLRPCREESVDFDNTQNLYIEGDNLDVLKVLRETYLGKVKMIYIDPPYNTGNDFVYNDDFGKDKDTFEETSGLFDEDGNQTIDPMQRNTESNGRFHTDWLNMIYPRLKVAKDLLTEDGVIFISIDDNEIENLQKICSEIFGASNCVARVIVNRPSEVATDLTVQKHEYCLVYAKNIQSIRLCGNKKTTISRGTVGNADQTMPIITFPQGLKCFNIPDGTYTQSRQIEGSMENIEVISPFVVENSYLKEPVQLKARWRSSNDMRNFFANHCMPTKAKINGIIEEIYFDGNRFMPYIKKSVTEKLPTMYLDNKRGSTDLEHLGVNYFDFPKSVSYISFLVSLFTEEEDIILDFFSGSSTTAHAVMKLNASPQNGHRKFIMVQLPEVLDKDCKAYDQGFITLCDIAKERIRRAGKKVKEEAGLSAQNLDTGFRVLKLDSSNMEDVYYTPQEFELQSLFNENVKADRTNEDLLFQVMLDLGIELSAKIESKQIAGKNVHLVDDNYLVACFDRDVNESTITEIAKLQPIYFVMRDASAANDNVIDNFEQIFKHYSPENYINGGFMKFKFKIQQYQTDAVENTVTVFTGQPSHRVAEYRIDRGKRTQQRIDFEGDTGFRNHHIELDGRTLLKNINAIQNLYDITPSATLSKGVGAVNLDIEMETGTGKTYVYIKTMFELNKHYGWSKFIIVVPSIAIREGVAKSFKMLEEHFMEYYGKKARWFIYNSSNLQQLDSFSSDSGLSVMIINTQAFAASMKEGGKSKESLIIYSKRDEFGSRRPIDVIEANHPIIIMDEPQKMEGDATQAGIKRFNPLFVLNYSATHKTKHDTIYALDALDAYRQKLVKRIHVKGFEVKNLRGTSSYLYLDNIVLSPKQPPMARIEIETKTASGTVVRKIKTFGVGDSLREESGLAQYDGFTVSEINVNGYVTFLNGTTIRRGEVIGDTNELNMQRVQIRETIMSHFEKERQLFKRGIKCLSLFFIDEVAKYKSYDEEGNEVKGVFQKMFEEEYSRLVSNEFHIWDEEYNEYLRRFIPKDVHRGYFSIDKETNRVIDGKVEKKTGLSDDISAYELILKNKERLLSFEEPTRFIFSHSALREGWDNPNVFQICTLRHSNSTTAKRQEVGRGLRICVDKYGTRMDAELLGEDVHEVNKLTVIANESYSDFTTALQRETRDVLRERAAKATVTYFTGKQIKIGEEVHTISETEASRIIIYLEDNGYIDDQKNITPEYREAVANGTVALLPQKLQPIAEGVTRLINSIFDPKALDDMVVEEKTTTPDNKLNENFDKAEFQALWNEINHQYVYQVSYDSNELIDKAIIYINKDFEIKQLRYVMVEGAQDESQVAEFGNTHSQSRELTDVCTSTVKYDLVGDIAKGANLTRKTVVKILQGIKQNKLYLFKNNPEEFIRKIISIIKEQKSTMIVEAIHYNITEGKYDSDIFTVKSKMDFDRAYEAKKHITDYVFSDSKGERQFAHDLDEASEVVVYAKLPRTFQIPTPVGNYAPDWAIAMKKNDVKHIFFVAETKGSMSSMDLSAIERAKIDCAEKLFNSISTANVKYHKVATYQDLIDGMNAIG